jgi:glycosyltransferase involved in cell wall biosynthesis
MSPQAASLRVRAGERGHNGRYPVPPDRARLTAGWPADLQLVIPLSLLPAQPERPKVKVLHIITRFMDGSGMSTLVTLLGADRTRYDVWLASSPPGDLWERAERSGVKTVKLPRLREVIAPLDDVIVLFQLVRLIRRERFLIIHTHSAKAGFLGRLAAWLCRTPIIVHTIHSSTWHEFMGRPRRWLYVTLERLVRPMTDAFIAVAPQIAREALELRLVRPGAVAVVQDAVELDKIPAGPDSQIRAELGVPADVPVVGTVGRLDFQKAPLDFVRMAASVAASHPLARFIWVGEGKLRDEAQAEARRLGVEIMFTGFRGDAPRIASCFDVYVVSSLYEGLGIALSEAQASGRPAVATAVNGVVDIVVPGLTGLLAPPADPEALGRSVVWLLDHPAAARQMGEAARARALTLFEPAVMCAHIEQVYSRLLGLPEPAAPTLESGETAITPAALEV